jgi:hypothetical protein
MVCRLQGNSGTGRPGPGWQRHRHRPVPEETLHPAGMTAGDRISSGPSSGISVMTGSVRAGKRPAHCVKNRGK